MATKADDYEAFLASIISGVSESERNIVDRGYGRNNRLKGKSGQSHQIDISFIDRSFEEEKLVLIECKRHKNSISVDVPKILTYNATDIGNNPDYPDSVLKIIVSISGFQAGTRRIAEYEGIRLHTVNHGPPFGFDYENIIFAGVENNISVSEVVTVEIEPPSEE